VKISIFGLGYVGSVSAGCLAALGHEVTGVDVNPIKVDMINAGQSPVIEAGLEDLIAQGAETGHLRADTSANAAIANSDLSLICVGTPSDDANGSLDLTYVERVCREIGQALAKKETYHVVIVRSTILPGSTEERVIPILENASGGKAGRDFGIAFNPEFLREGTAVRDFYHPPFTLIGQMGDESTGGQLVSTTVADLYSGIDAPLLTVPLKVAEMVKYANNAFHALKVAFANEIGNICKRQNIDSHQVMSVFCRDDKLNISPAYLKPGFAFGGSCLPKDLRALLYLGRHLDLHLPVLEAILPSNEMQIRIGLDMIAQTGKRKVGVLGFSFKAGTDDLRHSAQVELIERLIGKGYQVRLFDRNVSLARLQGTNKTYIEREIPHIATLMCASVEEVLAESEVVVIGNRDESFASALENPSRNPIVIDLVRIMEHVTSADGRYRGICW
jgi:GDP-mannose 6-dehydrogenase